MGMKKTTKTPVIGVFWADREQFGVGIPKVNEGYDPLHVEDVAEFIEELDKLCEDKFGDELLDAGCLRKVLFAMDVPTCDHVPEGNDFRRINLR